MAGFPLDIYVLEHVQPSGRPIFNIDSLAGQESQFSLNKHELPQPDELVRWSAMYAESRGINDLQSALDAFMSACTVGGDLLTVCYTCFARSLNCADRLLDRYDVQDAHHAVYV